MTGQKIAVRHSAWPFILIAALLVIFTVAVPMAVNTQMAQRAYEIRDQRVALAEMTAQVETLEAEVLAASSPQRLETKAREIGLVPAGGVGVISLESRTIDGGEPAE